jgi:hypothetical protein
MSTVHDAAIEWWLANRGEHTSRQRDFDAGWNAAIDEFQRRFGKGYEDIAYWSTEIDKTIKEMKGEAP